MKEELMEILACPICKGDLKLNTEEKRNDEILKESLYCKKCDERYPIEENIPNLLPPLLRS